MQASTRASYLVVPDASARAGTADLSGDGAVSQPAIWLGQVGVNPEHVRIESSAGTSVVGRTQGAPASQNGVVGLSQFARVALGVGIGDTVYVNPVTLNELARCTLVPPMEVPEDSASRDQLTSALRTQPIPVDAGMFVQLPVGRRSGTVTFFVSDTKSGPGLLGPLTQIEILPPNPALFEPLREPLGIESVAGLGAQVQELMQVVGVPLQNPRLYADLGIRPVRGVLLYGPPGTGKTLLCRALAKEIGVAFLHVNAPEVVGGHHGETEKQLRLLFRKAFNLAPCIIFLDEIDAIARSRESLSSQADQRAVAQLLSLMDGLTASEGVVVVATTNRLETIDEAFRRPGRFDQEIYIGPPDERGRREVLRVHTREMPLGNGIDEVLDDIAARTPGFTGADLAGLCRGAAVAAIRRTMGLRSSDSVQEGLAEIFESETRNLRVEAEDFAMATASAEPSTGRMYRQRHRWSLTHEVESVEARQSAELLREVARLRLSPDGEEVRGAAPRGIILRSEDPGLAAHVSHSVAKGLAVNVVEFSVPEQLSQWQGETEQRVRGIAARAVRLQPCILQINQFDLLQPLKDDVGSRDRLLGQLLDSLDGMLESDKVFVVGISEGVHTPTEIIRRPGRFELLLTLEPPSEASRDQIIGVSFTSTAPFPMREMVLEATEGMSASMTSVFSELCRHLAEKYPESSAPQVISDARRLFSSV